MAGTYSQMYVHIDFSVKRRQKLLHKPWRVEVFKYISCIIEEKGQKAIIVNGVSDHIHILVGLKPALSVSDLVRDIKNNSSKFINKQNWLSTKFNWQAGFGCFTYSQTQMANVYHYILKQEKHHESISFEEEYLDVIKKFDVSYDEKYLFD